MNNFFIILLSLALAGCSASTNEETSVQDKVVVQSASTGQLDTIDSFHTFYEQFIVDSVFQISRVKFPLEGNYSGLDREEEWTKEKWPYMTWDYREEIVTTGDSTSVIQTDTTFYFGEFCLGCGFSFWMEFKKLNGEWYLTSRQENNY